MKSILRIIAVVFVAGIAWFLRARAVALLPVDYDEDDYLRAAQEYAHGFREGDLQVLQQSNYRPEHPPLAKILFGLSITSLPEVDLVPDLPTSAAPNEALPTRHLHSARTISAIFGTLEALLLAILSPLGGFLLAIHTFTIKYTSQVMLEGFPALTSAISVIAFERWFSAKDANRRFHGGWLLLSGITLGFTAASKYIYAVVGIVTLAYWIWRSYSRMRNLPVSKIIAMFRPILLWGVLSIMVFFLANPYLWPAPVDRLSNSILYHGRYATGAEEVQRANYVFWQPLNTLFMSVPWHPGVFVVMLDTFIAILAVLGFRQAWRKRSIYALWLLLGLIFLLLWPTKWPQYTLMVTFPLALIAREGLTQHVLSPLQERFQDLRARGLRWGVRRVSPSERREGRRSLPWLLPGALVLLAITFFPLLYQGAIALTDFNATSIRDGLDGGIWREVVAGLSGEVEPTEVDLFSFNRSTSREVHYTGFKPLLQIFGPGMSLLLFEILWTGSVVGLQVVLGVAAALLLHRRGVRLKGLWQTILILPWAIPEFVGALVWMQIFDPRFGWFFLGSKSFGETPGFVYAQQLASWQENPNAAMGVLLVAGIWLGFPLIMLAASAGLKMIPEEVYEAAALDGASGFNLFRNITWPLLLPLLAPALIIRAIYAFNQFYLFFVLNPPFPLVTFANISYYFFYFGGQYAASAIVNILAVVILIFFLFGFNRISRAGEGVTYA